MNHDQGLKLVSIKISSLYAVCGIQTWDVLEAMGLVTFYKAVTQPERLEDIRAWWIPAQEMKKMW
jgi:hypothetical protein